MKTIFKNSAVEWDVKTITAGDYSVEVKITKTMWQNFQATLYNPADVRAKLTQFRDYFNQTFCKALTALPDLGYEDEPPKSIRISLIQFAFDNSELINLLKARGNAIKYENFKLMHDLNKKIDELKT